MNLYGLFILDVNIKYIVFSILYRHINVPMACKELGLWEHDNMVPAVCRLPHWFLSRLHREMCFYTEMIA